MKLKSAVASLALIAALGSPAIAGSEIFYRNDVGPWTIVGRTSDGKLAPVCLAEYNFKDGSYFTLFKDLNDGEVYALIRNTQWQIIDAVNTQYQARINFYINGSVTGGNATYELLNKNAIRFRNLKPSFVDLFMGSTKFELIMPGNIPNATMPLSGSRAASNAIVECLKAADNRGNLGGPGIDS